MSTKTNDPGDCDARANSPLDEIESEDNHPQFNSKSANSQENCRIYRTDKTTNSGNPFTRTDNRVIYDTSLTPLARLAMVYLLSKPDNWQVRKSDLRRYLECGVNKVETILRELQDAGYIVRYQPKTDKGYWLPAETLVYEVPDINPDFDNGSMKTIERPNSVSSGSMKSVPTDTVPTDTVPTDTGALSNNGQATTDLPTTEEKTKKRESHEKNEISNGKNHEQADVVNPLSLSENSSHFSSVGIYKSVTNGFINAAVEKTCQEIQAYPNYSDDKFLEVLVQLDSQGDGKNKPLFQAGKILAAAQKEFSGGAGVSKVKLFDGEVVEARIERDKDGIWAVYETQSMDGGSRKSSGDRFGFPTVEKRVSVEEAYYGGSVVYEEREPHIDVVLSSGNPVLGRLEKHDDGRHWATYETKNTDLDTGEITTVTRRVAVEYSGTVEGRRIFEEREPHINQAPKREYTPIEEPAASKPEPTPEPTPEPEPETMADKWQNVKEFYLKRAMSTDTYHQHFAQTKVLGYNDNTNVLTVGAAEMSIEWLETRLEPPIREAIKYAGYDFTVKFVSLEDVKRAIFSK